VRWSLRFLRHDGIYRSDVVSKPSPPGLGVPPPVGRPPGSGKGRHGRTYAPCSPASSAMSSGRLFLDRVGRHQSPSLLHRHPHPKTVPGWGTMSLQRTANSVLTVCLSSGDNRMSVFVRASGPQAFCRGSKNIHTPAKVEVPQLAPTRNGENLPSHGYDPALERSRKSL